MILLVPAAYAWQPPNSTLGASVGLPNTLGGHGEAWFADELSLAVGAGTTMDPPKDTPMGMDAAFRWHPEPLCLLCDRRAMVTLAVGAGCVVLPDVQLDAPWDWAVGPELSATFVYWFSPAYGLSVTANGGGGPALHGTQMDGARPWMFGTLGLAF